jgi:hypothetical protein
MAESIVRKKYGWGTLYLKFDPVQASSTIRYSIDGPDDWQSTPFQTADARHSKPKALALVNRWLRGQNPAGQTLLFRTRAAAQKYAREHGAKKFSIKKLKRGK